MTRDEWIVVLALVVLWATLLIAGLHDRLPSRVTEWLLPAR